MYKIKDELITPETSGMAVRCGFDRFKLMESIQIMPDEDPSILYQPPVTQSLLARWLREVHGIHVWVEPDWERVVRDKIIDRFVACIYYMPAPPTIPKVRAGETTELALEAGLQEALKLLPDANDAPKD